MGFISKLGPEFGVAQLILKSIFISLLGIFLLVGFIVLRRWYRGRYFLKLNERTLALRSQWDDILTGRTPAGAWRLKKLDCEIVESILLDSIESATAEQLPLFLGCLRSSGLLDLRIHEARNSQGWKRRTALVALGRTRAVEAVPALAQALEATSKETRIAAVRGLGRIGLVQAAIPILDLILLDELNVPEHTVKNALANCCQNSAPILLKYLNRASGPARDLLARVMGELATGDLGEDLIVLATDPAAEVRASAARALGNARSSFALPVLSVMVNDKEWFVRLRAVVALASIDSHARMRPLLRALCDSNRYVRLRAAWALAQMQPQLEQILHQVVETQDDYALQAFISELERTGSMDDVVHVLEQRRNDSPAVKALLEALKIGQRDIEQAAKVKGAAAGAR